MSDVTSTRQRNTGFGEGRLKLTTRDADVGDVSIELGEIGTKEDETKVPVGRDLALRVALSEKPFLRLWMWYPKPFPREPVRASHCFVIKISIILIS